MKRSRSLSVKVRHIKDLALALLAEAEALGADQHPVSEQGLCLREAVRRFEIELITDALRRSGGNQARAAALLGTKITTLNQKIKQYRLRTNSFPRAAVEHKSALNVSTRKGPPAASGAIAENPVKVAAG